MYTIGKLARKTRVKVDNIRLYERQGLVVAEEKSAVGYRLFTDAAVRRLMLIKHAQRCGFTLAEIGKLLELNQGATAARAAAVRLAIQKKTQIDETIEIMRAMSEGLAAVMASHKRNDGQKGRMSAEDILVMALESLSTHSRSRPARNDD